MPQKKKTQLESIVLLQIINFHCRNVLVKGGDLPNSPDAIDIFYDGKVKVLNSQRHNHQNKISETTFFLLHFAMYIQIYVTNELHF
jgi:hydroxymethylpyrimidine/phosphomethylpyrimidine kinase